MDIKGFINRTVKEPQRAFYTHATILTILVALYLVTHWLNPTGQPEGFFWVETPLQWIDWVFWGISGVLLNILSTSANRQSGILDGQEPSSRTFLQIVRGVIISLVVVFLINLLKIKITGIEINFSTEPAIVASLAFIFGFYEKVTYKYIFSILAKIILRSLRRLFHPILMKLGHSISEQAYVQEYIEPKLQEHYMKAAKTTTGRNGHKKSYEKLARYKSAKFVGNAGFTLNLVRTVYIGTIPEYQRAEIIAHEASHIAQGDLSDSIYQETEAYITGVKTNYEIKNPGIGIPDKPREKWLKIEKELHTADPDVTRKARKKAKEEVRKLKYLAPLYGIIPEKQKKGVWDFFEMVRQGGFLLMDAIGLRKLED